MYRHCIFCSADLGANETIENFPVGRKLAFDAWKGRLWVVCSRCERWNLSPLEERWEAVEEAEKRFADARLRVQSENIGLAKLTDGTRLIRVGAALPGELAAWRYEGRLIQRHRRHVVTAGLVGAGLLAATVGTVAVVGGAVGLYTSLYEIWQDRQHRKVIHRVGSESSPTGEAAVIRRWHVQGAYLAEDPDEEIELCIPNVDRKKPKYDWIGKLTFSDEAPLILRSVEARTVLGRAMVHVNHKGATRSLVQDATRLLSDEGSAEAYLRRVAREGGVLGKRKDLTPRVLAPAQALALEMALHEETERRALEGELTLLESAWRDAEEIAAIADALPDDPLPRLPSH
jgi:hypothetical protein